MGQAPAPPAESPAHLCAGFLAVLPTIERQARFTFRHLQRSHDREDAVVKGLRKDCQAGEVRRLGVLRAVA